MKSDFVVCSPVFASRHKQIPLLPVFDACGDSCSLQGWKLEHLQNMS